MKLAVMQPYLFPYLGYFQLVRAVDTFVFYDDVAFNRRGWILRNRILVHGEPHLFSVPVKRASSGTPINRTYVATQRYPRWRRRFLETLRRSYARSRSLEPVLDLVSRVLTEDPDDVASLAERSVRECCSYLGIDVKFLVSSVDFPAAGARGVERIVGICRTAGASSYVNLPGGTGSTAQRLSRG